MSSRGGRSFACGAGPSPSGPGWCTHTVKSWELRGAGTVRGEGKDCVPSHDSGQCVGFLYVLLVCWNL